MLLVTYGDYYNVDYAWLIAEGADLSTGLRQELTQIHNIHFNAANDTQGTTTTPTYK